ncbi:MAG: c-type cytochrome [Sphingobacteriales bacterium]|uniref:c-type cytochrome n=1 Tax=Hydrotalea flava TaxID=714549 RepID=UPI0008367935|nr:cytochrome c [Hydrotalea flava]RTL47646.1 MAG: c-type cytochrome [Sphingobacteriales bacterium]
MKKLSILIVLFSATAVLFSCSDIKRKPNRIYMPDMFYSRAYQTYTDHSNLTKEGIFYNEKPVVGTIARGEDMPFPLAKDAPGDTTNYAASKLIKSPIDSLTPAQYVETERLFLVNCAICHGPKLDGNGPLYKGGEGPYPAKPAQLVGDTKYEAMPEGQMFYSVEYGKNLMGSYASQLSRQQRWQIIRYIKMKQAEGKANTATASK